MKYCTFQLCDPPGCNAAGNGRNSNVSATKRAALTSTHHVQKQQGPDWPFSRNLHQHQLHKDTLPSRTPRKLPRQATIEPWSRSACDCRVSVNTQHTHGSTFYFWILSSIGHNFMSYEGCCANCFFEHVAHQRVESSTSQGGCTLRAVALSATVHAHKKYLLTTTSGARGGYLLFPCHRCHCSQV